MADLFHTIGNTFLVLKLIQLKLLNLSNLPSSNA